MSAGAIIFFFMFTISMNVFDNFDDFFLRFDDFMLYLSGRYGYEYCCPTMKINRKILVLFVYIE